MVSNCSCSVVLIARLYLCLLSFNTSPILADFDSHNLFHNDVEGTKKILWELQILILLIAYNWVIILHLLTSWAIMSRCWMHPGTCQMNREIQLKSIRCWSMYRYVIYLLVPCLVPSKASYICLLLLCAVELMIFPNWIQWYDNSYLIVWFPFFSLILESFIVLFNRLPIFPVRYYLILMASQIKLQM